MYFVVILFWKWVIIFKKNVFGYMFYFYVYNYENKIVVFVFIIFI